MLKKVLISNGPSREEMFDSLRLINEERYVEFKTENSTFKALIFLIVATIPNGEDWGAEITIENCDFVSTFGLLEEEKENFKIFPVITCRITYSTKTRKGEVSF